MNSIRERIKNMLCGHGERVEAKGTHYANGWNHALNELDEFLAKEPKELAKARCERCNSQGTVIRGDVDLCERCHRECSIESTKPIERKKIDWGSIGENQCFAAELNSILKEIGKLLESHLNNQREQ